ncbi:MAG: hypothetical protein KBH11_07610 [Bacteroidia bacterium]|nr:hypothetical protein [Bacteroidia bacterium]
MKYLIICVITALLPMVGMSQELSEAVQPLSKKAIKGFLYDVTNSDDGGSILTYKMKVDKKSDAVQFEEYAFDNTPSFTTNKDVEEKKVSKPDKEVTGFYANVGGTNSFDVLSMKLKLNKYVQLKTWNHERQRYIVKKTLSRETIKPRNDDGKTYLGYASYSSSDDAQTDVLVIAKAESKDKTQADQFRILMFNDQLEIKESLLELTGAHTLVFCEQLPDDDVIAVFAPNKGNGEASNYVYFRFNIKGSLKERIPFMSPAPALLLTAVYQRENQVFLFGSSPEEAEFFNKTFSEYAPIFNPGYTEGGNNRLDFNWQKSLSKKMANFHLIKFNNNKMEFATNIPVSDFKSKFKTAPGDKGATPYNGKRFYIENFFVTPADEYLIAGQLSAKVNMGSGNIVDSYEDLVCFHFSKDGVLKAQYGLGKLNNDKKSEIFSMQQNFYLAADGNSVFWEILEVKGVKGYEDFLDAYYDNPSFYPLYFPRVGKIDLTNNTLGAFKVMGDQKYFLKRNFTSYFNKSNNSVTYFGHDEDYTKIWIGKMKMQ